MHAAYNILRRRDDEPAAMVPKNDGSAFAQASSQGGGRDMSRVICYSCGGVGHFATYSNHVRSSPSTLVSGRSIILTNNLGKTYTRLGQDESGSLWFARFVEGCRRRMGQDWRPDQAMSPALLLALLESIEQEVTDSDSPERSFRLILPSVWRLQLGLFPCGIV